jgi:predicted ATPase
LPSSSRVILRDQARNILLQAQDVGVGISQTIPVLVALLDRAGGDMIAIEQPELHLHPKQQAALGDVLIESMNSRKRRIIIAETHSEHLILRLLRRIRETKRKTCRTSEELVPSQLRIAYVQRSELGARVSIIDADVNGDLVDPWPDDFFEQDFKERFT